MNEVNQNNNERVDESGSSSTSATSTVSTCPECDGRIIRDEEHGEVICKECGVVVDEETVDRGPEWRAFYADEAEEKSRVGAPTTELLHDKGLSSVISWENKDAHGQSLSAKKRQKMQRLRTWDERFRNRDSQDRNLRQALTEIERMASALGVPETQRETASVIYRRALADDLLRGRSIEGVASACVYYATRQAGIPRTLDEIVVVSRVERKEIGRTYKYLVDELGLAVEPTQPLAFLPRFASRCDVSDEVERRAEEILDGCPLTNEFSGTSPDSLAAAALYAAARLSNEKRTQSEVADATGVTTGTIRKHYPRLLELSSE